MMIDTHCHLSKNDYDDLEEVISRMGINIMIASGADMDYNAEVLDLIKKYKNIYGTIGLHPDEASNYRDEDIFFIEKNLTNEKIVGIGEIGLDYSRENINIQKQKELFIKQLDLARKYNMPVVIHSRDAINDTYDILKDYKDLKIVIHCFSSSLDMAKKFICLGAKLGIGGVLTFKNGKKLQEVASNIDLKYLLLETDSPYLTPEPYRGLRNEPSYLHFVASKLAEIKNISIEEVYNVTTQNALEVYNIKL